jgi:hypothetical protein
MDPYNDSVWRILAVIYLNEDKLCEAFNCYQGYLFHTEKDKNDPVLWYELGDLYK